MQMSARAKDLQGKVALVVGCGIPGGIGAVVAGALAEAGAKIVLADLAGAKLDEISRALQVAKFEVAACPVELTDENSVRSLIEFVTRTFGRLDSVVNVAAATNLIPRDQGVIDMSGELWDEMFAVNARGAMLVCKHAIPAMLEHGGGAIVNVSAGRALRGDVEATAYSASKAAMNSLTRSVATIYGDKGIRCNAIAPGPIATDLFKAVVPHAMVELIKDCTLLGRLGEPEDIANLAVFLASDRSSFITAQIIQCDGGTLDYLPTRYGLRSLSKKEQGLPPREPGK
jgi:NAD(P)-dependent dehydrogenase (short-subunit alcohol dehydrogenase family)